MPCKLRCSPNFFHDENLPKNTCVLNIHLETSLAQNVDYDSDTFLLPASSWSTLRRWPWCFKVFLLLSAITSRHLRSVGWGGVGWGWWLPLNLHTWSVLRNIMFLALAHMVGATQHHVSCTCTHGRCYATSCFLHLHTWSVLRNIMFLALAHMVGATQHHVSCTCTHGRCYPTSCFLHLHTRSLLRNIMFLALAHMVGASQHHVSCTCNIMFLLQDNGSSFVVIIFASHVLQTK